jgi:hypothetical protein
MPASTSTTVVVGATVVAVGTVVDVAIGDVVDVAGEAVVPAAPTDSAGTATMTDAIDARGPTTERGYRGDRTAVRHPPSRRRLLTAC